ncbi:hypothetical protein ACIQHY_12870 [Streptomyces sp. NPDC092359]|uniref:hypothetical protein n=1 Tax=Streptomyces sp. NPDC092359 TaxID=3366014 RepID=UPI00382FAEF1
MGDEALFRTVNEEAGARAAPAASGFSAAVRYAGEATAALGEVAQQLTFLEQTEHLHDRPDARDAREAAGRVIEDRLETAGTALWEAADSLHAASTTVSPPSSRLRAALTRTTNPAHKAMSAASAAPTAQAAPAVRNPRGR